jgi:acyl-CoA thioester hydrolase
MNFFYKIRYAETDQMGVVHHGNYALYLEQSRIDWLDCKGLNYSKLEKDGVMLPVLKMEIEYKRPLHFGETVRVNIHCVEEPRARIKFDYKLYNNNDELVALARVELAFISATTRRPIRCPQSVLKLLSTDKK